MGGGWIGGIPRCMVAFGGVLAKVLSRMRAQYKGL